MDGYAYTQKVAERLNRSVRDINYTLTKLVNLGAIERYDRNQHRCPHQAYMIPRDREVVVTRFLEWGLAKMAAMPWRYYFIFEWVSATLPSTYEQQRLPGFAGDRSVPFNAKRPRMRGAMVARRLVPQSMWVPFDSNVAEIDCFSDDSLFERLLMDLEAYGYDYGFSDEYEVPFDESDGFGEDFVSD
jgi:hypothetical protein